VVVGSKAGAGGLELVEMLSPSSSSFVAPLLVVLAAVTTDKITGKAQSFVYI